MGHTWCILIYIWNLIFRFSNWPDVACRPCNARVAPADAQGTTSGFKILPKDTSICTVVESLIEQLTLWLVDGSLYLTKHSCDNQQLQLLGQYHINVKKKNESFPPGELWPDWCSFFSIKRVSSRSLLGCLWVQIERYSNVPTLLCIQGKSQKTNAPESRLDELWRQIIPLV